MVHFKNQRRKALRSSTVLALQVSPLARMHDQGCVQHKSGEPWDNPDNAACANSIRFRRWILEEKKHSDVPKSCMDRLQSHAKPDLFGMYPIAAEQ